jgi:hypothetical protein
MKGAEGEKSQDERPPVSREVQWEDFAVKGCSVLLLCWAVDADDADGAVIEVEVDAQDASAAAARMNELGRATEVQPRAEDDDDALGVAGARHVEDPHAGPDRACPCRDLEDVGRVRR